MSTSKKKEITKEKMEVYEIAFAMFIKFILVIAGLVAFFIVLTLLINTTDNQTKVIYGCFDILLGGSIYVVYRHYFPDKK
jgi:hypothetical protein